MSPLLPLVLVALTLSLATSTTYPRGFTANCMKCICQTDACLNSVRCRTTYRRCSDYNINERYWETCGKPNKKTYSQCMAKKWCKEKCVVKYLSHYNPGKDLRTCFHYARNHMAGPWGWRYRSTLPYRNKVEECCKKIPGGC